MASESSTNEVPAPSHAEAHAYVAAHAPEEVRAEIERWLATVDEDGAALLRATRLAELSLVAKLAPWRVGSVVPNVRSAIEKVSRGSDPDATTARIALRLAACHARAGRTDDDALRLSRHARARLVAGGLAPDDRGFASEAAHHLERAVFVPSLECVHEIVSELEPESVEREARAQIARRNHGFAALLLELAIHRAYAKSRKGVPNQAAVEKSLAAFRDALAQGGGRTHADLAVTLARAYVEGAFVDIRARDHAKAVKENLADKLDPVLAAKLESYLEQDAFDIPDAALYEIAKKHAKEQPLDLRLAVSIHVSKGNLAVARRLCEMELVRRFDPWYVGDPSSNVARAVTRAASALAQLDEGARWTACQLAALYAAMLEGTPPARALVTKVLEQEAAAPDLRAALEQAGLDPDVPAEELRAVYDEATNSQVRHERFRARADAANLSDYERTAGIEVLDWLDAQETAEGSTSSLAIVPKRLGSLVEVVVPDTIMKAATSAIEAALRNAAAESGRIVGRSRILRLLSKSSISSLEGTRTGDLSALDKVAWSVTHENRVLAALEGFGCGLGGATLVIIDVPALVTMNLNAIAAIATVYGFDVDSPEEHERSLSLLASGHAALKGDLEPDAVGRVAIRRMARDTFGGSRAALALRSVAVRLGGRLAKQKLLQLLPVLGGAVGAGLNYHFTLETTRAAYMLYRYRWIQRKTRAGKSS